MFGVKKLGSDHFRKAGRFFRSLEIVGRTEQGAGELGPLGSAGRVKAFPLKTQH